MAVIKLTDFFATGIGEALYYALILLNNAKARHNADGDEALPRKKVENNENETTLALLKKERTEQSLGLFFSSLKFQ